MDGLLSLGWRRDVAVESVHRVNSLEESVDTTNRDPERKKKRRTRKTDSPEDTPETDAQHVVDLTL
jgi:hypothetical protein